MTFATANGEPVQSMDLELAARGAWRATLLVATDDAPAAGSRVVIEAPGGRFVGTARRAGADQGGQVSMLVVGGADRLTTIVEPASFRDTPVRDLVAGILDPLGEVLSARSDQAVLGRVLPSWPRTRIRAADALSMLVEDAEPAATWRVLDDGTVWLGIDAGEAVSPEHTVTHDAPEEGLLELAVEDLSLRPGHSFLGGPVRAAAYRLDGTSLRLTVHRTDGGSRASRGLAAAAQRALAGAGVQFHALTPARVVSQNADGSLELVADSTTIAAPPRVRLRTGLPGEVTVKLAPGAEVLLGFEGGDRRRPFAALPLRGGRLLHLVVDGDRFEWGGADAVAIASKVDDRFAALEGRVRALEAWGPSVTPPFPGAPGTGGESTASEALFSR